MFFVFFFVLDTAKDNFFQCIVEHKDILKLVAVLRTAVSSQKDKTMNVLKQFNSFRPLWEDDRNLIIKVCFILKIQVSLFVQK